MKKLVTKTLLTSGQNAYALNVRMLITRDVFGRALSEESFAYGDISFATLSKKRAIELLNKRLRFHGSEGEFQGLDDIGDRQDELNEEYRKACDWIDRNYPYLKP